MIAFSEGVLLIFGVTRGGVTAFFTTGTVLGSAGCGFGGSGFGCSGVIKLTITVFGRTDSAA